MNTASSPTEFRLPDDGNRNALLDHIQQSTACEIEPAQRLSRIYYDTFDWRLYQANLYLYRDKSRKFSRYALQSRTNGTLVAILDIKDTAVFAHNFAPGPLREKLLPLLEMRALLPLATIQREVIPVRILNKTNKTIVQLMLEHNRIRKPKASQHKLDDFRICVLPMRGYWKHAGEARMMLEQISGLTQAHEDLFDLAMQSMGQVPGSYTSKLSIPLNPQERADKALQIILKNLYHTMRINEPGLKSNIDSEFLHDYRVAVRRTRSALSQIKHVLPLKQVEKFKKEFSWLGTITSPPRDLDVHLLNFDEYARSLPESMRSDLDPLRNFLLNLRDHEYEKLKKNLSSSHYRKFRKNWATFLASDLSTRIPAEHSDKPIAWVARKYTWRTYNRVLKQGDMLEATSPAPQFHELRKTCKKLRYLMEFFASLYPEKEIRSLIKTLKSLQENLGDFQDLDIHAQSMRKFAEQMLKKEHASSKTLMAMGALAENLERQKMEVHEKFSVVYRTFREKKNQNLFESLFKPVEETREPVS